MEVLDSREHKPKWPEDDQLNLRTVSEVSVITTIHIKLLLPYSMELLN